MAKSKKNNVIVVHDVQEFTKNLQKITEQLNSNTLPFRITKAKIKDDFCNYDYESHVKLLQELDDARKLSRTFTTIPLRSNTEFVWNDVNRMHGLNMEQSRRNQQNHICPMPFDEVDRLIEFYSMPGEIVADPFGGIGTTGVRALKKGRKAILTELNDLYAKTAAIYMKETEMKNNLPTLFDMIIANN